MKQVLNFLRDLSLHKEREWFNAHKNEFLKARSTVNNLASTLMEGIRSFDDSIGQLSPADCTYRIYRDLRFSKDKSPYKTHMGIFINPGGKKSGFAGYYFHVSGSEEPHMVAIGDYMTEPKVLRILREDIEMGGGDFRKILSKVDGRLRLDDRDALKKTPIGFPADSPDAEYFRLRKFCLWTEVDDNFILAPEFPGNLLEIFKTAKPFLDYVNRAIEFSRETQGDYLL